MAEEFVKDNYERPIVSLRITITNRCNENCIYQDEQRLQH